MHSFPGEPVLLTDVECAQLSYRLWRLLTTFIQSRQNLYLKAQPTVGSRSSVRSGDGQSSSKDSVVSDDLEIHPSARLILHTHLPKSHISKCILNAF